MADLLTFSPIDMTSVAGAAVNGVAGLLGMSGSSHYQRKNMREAARLQHEENVFWAEYNTPENQMARLRAAGLNPNLVYGNGADAQAQGSVSPSGGMPNADFKLGSDILMMQNMVAQNKNLEEQNKLLKAQTKKETNTAEGIELENMRKRGTNPFQYGSYESMEQHWKALNAKKENEKIASAIALQNAEKFGREISNRFENAASYLKLDQLTVDLAISRINQSYLPNLLENQVKLSQAQQGQAYATILELGALSAYYSQAKETSATQAELNRVEKDIRDRRAILANLGLNPDDNSVTGALINALVGIAAAAYQGKYKEVFSK